MSPKEPRKMTNNIKLENNDEEDDSKIFPQRLMEILADPRAQESICWLPHGRAFIIRKRDKFAEEVMPLYFSRKAKYSSFTRKLNRWNFVRVSSGPELGAYYHEFFLRDKPHLAAQMFCKNARTILAMASDTETKRPTDLVAPPSAVKPAPVAAAAELVAPPQAQMPPVTPALLAALSKSAPPANNKNAALLRTNNNNEATTNLQLLELHLKQQEQANRILLEHAMALSHIQQRQEQQRALEQQSRLLQMRQLMDMRTRRQQDASPSNPRASAA